VRQWGQRLLENNFDTAIETFDLTKKFSVKKTAGESGSKKQDIFAVRNVNIKVRRGEFFGLLGPNGAGKTTLIKMLCTLILPTSGTAFIKSFDIVKEERKVRESVGLIPGDVRRIFYYRLSGRQNLEFFAALYNIPRTQARERIKELLELVELEKWGDEKVMRYSTGMLQRLGMARGLLHNPPILLMDEPTVGLDPRYARATRDFIKKELNEREGKTILLTTHYMEEADQLCSRVAIMDSGKIVIVDNPANMKKLVKEEDIIELEVSNIIPRMEEEINVVKGVKRMVVDFKEETIGLGKMRIHASDSRIVLPHVIDNIVKCGGKVISFKTSEPTLEDVFLKFTGRGLL